MGVLVVRGGGVQLACVRCAVLRDILPCCVISKLTSWIQSPNCWLQDACQHSLPSSNTPPYCAMAAVAAAVFPSHPQAFLLYWVLWPAAGWPASLVTRVLLLVLPQALWVVMHVLLWVSMRRVLQHFRWAVGASMHGYGA
jgi:hypothetical protein